METFKFKTNINCGGCIAKVTPFMKDAAIIKNWKVETASPEKTLIVETDANAEEVKEIVERAGFKAEQIT
jgi:copper chaperone